MFKTTFWQYLILNWVALFSLQSELALAISEKKAAEIGKTMHEEIVAQMPIYEAPKLNNYIAGIGQKLVKYSDLPDTKFTFTIIDSPELNAFATPGAYIYINRGLLVYMNSEAQLAAVLSHELAHVTADHASRQKNAQTGSTVVAGLLAMLTGSAEVGEASAMWGQATVRGYGRDMELEADAIGAKIMARAGYPVEAMITIISQLKDHERFMKKRNKDSGKKTPGYHGIFSTHPRNDKRLLEIVRDSGEHLDSSKAGNPGVVPFRVATEGLPWGQADQLAETQKNRYQDNKLNFSFDYPEGWTFQQKVQQKAQQVLGGNNDQSATLNLEIKARTLDSPDQYIKKVLGISFIKKSEAIVITGLKGHTGTLADKTSNNDIRLTVIYYGRYAYVFRGTVKNGMSLDDISTRADNNNSQSYDDEFKSIIASFQPQIQRRATGQAGRIHYVKASSSATYAKVARQLKLGRYGGEELQLMNGDYPGGEPTAGQWIKIIR